MVLLVSNFKAYSIQYESKSKLYCYIRTPEVVRFDLILLFFFVIASVKGQKQKEALPPKLIQTLDFSSALPEETKYLSKISEGIYSREELTNRLSFELLYSINYPILRKLTLGVTLGVRHHCQGSISTLKVGGVLRYYFNNYKGINVYITRAKNIGISNNIKKKEGAYGNNRIGLQFPIQELVNFDNFRVTAKIYWESDSFALKKPILDEESAFDIEFRRTFGIGIGLQF